MKKLMNINSGYLSSGFKVCLLLVCLSFTQSIYAAAAGKVIFFTGSSKAVSNTGISRTVSRGDEIFSGDNLQTAARSRLQISLSDGAYVSVQPNSEYKLEDYNYSGKTDGSEKAFYRLLKGGIRAVTGLIGKKNRDAYQVRTAVATIGIRGTGHNTRICAGDCPGQKDGLHHYTSEGETTVQNDREEKRVPAGKGVFVKDKNAPIESKNQPSGATRVDTATKEKEEQEEDEEAGTLVSAGNQRTEEGDQIIVTPDAPLIEPTFSQIKTNQSVLAVGPEEDLSQMEGNASALFNTTIFKNADGKPVAVFGIEEDDDEMGNIEQFLTFATIDPGAALGADDAVLVAEIQALIDLADPTQIDLFLSNPAEVGEFDSTPEGLFAGRWTNGNVLSLIQDLDTGLLDETAVDELTGFQSIHFIYGDAPGPIPTSGGALYNMTISTDSTSNSGDTIGNGAINGFISVSFSTSDALINLDVDHNSSLYSISGNLMIDGEFLFDQNGVVATTGTAGSACNPSCITIIDGGFAGPGAPSMPTMPNNIGIEYEILETDIITGVAGFSYETVAP